MGEGRRGGKRKEGEQIKIHSSIKTIFKSQKKRIRKFLNSLLDIIDTLRINCP